MSPLLADKVAVITGGASGIARATALRFAQEGARGVVIGDLNAEAGEEVVAELRAAGARAQFVPTDVTSEQDCRRLVGTAVRELGGVDVCFAAAAILRGPGASDDPDEQRLIDLPTRAWRAVMDVDLRGVLLTNRAAAAAMIERGAGGAIINVASAAARRPFPGIGDYSVAKRCVAALTQGVAAELAGDRIRVNAIAPGFVDTPMTERWTSDAQLKADLEGRALLGRVARPEEIANTAVFLASDLSSYFTGELLSPAGGMFLGAT